MCVCSSKVVSHTAVHMRESCIQQVNIKVVVGHALSDVPTLLPVFLSLYYCKKEFCSSLRSWGIQVCRFLSRYYLTVLVVSLAGVKMWPSLLRLMQVGTRELLWCHQLFSSWIYFCQHQTITHLFSLTWAFHSIICRLSLLIRLGIIWRF